MHLSTQHGLPTTQPGAAARSPPVMSHKHKVSLVVERHHAPALEVGVLAEKRRKHAPDAVAQPRAEVVEHQLRLVACGPAVALDVAPQHQVCEPAGAAARCGWCAGTAADVQYRDGKVVRHSVGAV